MSILDGLNEEQKQAVLHVSGPLLIIAGAGSGKTKALTHRIARLIETGVSPNNILAITFTNKAAEEMRERVLKLIRPNSGGRESHPFISTFHALGVRVLREDAEKLKISKRFSIIDEDDALKIIKGVIKDLDLKEETFAPSRVKNFISVQKNRLASYEDLYENARDYFPKIMAEAWFRYEEALKEQNLLDFDDLIIKTIKLFKECPDILKKYRERWKYIHIDEYQDTNHPQYVLSLMLSAPLNNICVVGDSDQAIYSFRGADFTNILNFHKDFQGAKIITLEKNYRSTKKILDAANILIAKNQVRHPKNLLSVKEDGDLPLLFAAGNEMEEAEFVASAARSILKENNSVSIAVLLRANFQSRIFEEFFLSKDVPYEMIGVKFFERKEIKDVLAYIKFSFNRNDFLSFARMANAPSCGLGEKTLLKYFKNLGGIPPQRKKEIDRLEKLADEILKLSGEMHPSEIIKKIFTESGYEEYLRNLGSDGDKRIENVYELVSLAKKYDELPLGEGIIKLLEESALMASADEFSNSAKNFVKITTVHAAKGLEFDAVFIVGLEEGLFPYQSFNDTNKEMKIEEERRLFYVALTRARKNIFLSYARTRTVFGDKKINKPSRFITDIKDKIITL